MSTVNETNLICDNEELLIAKMVDAIRSIKDVGLIDPDLSARNEENQNKNAEGEQITRQMIVIPNLTDDDLHDLNNMAPRFVKKVASL